MGKRYSISHQATNSAAKCLLGLTGATSIRPRVYDLICGSDADPADNAAEYNLLRTTAAGSGGTAITPQAIDADDPASSASAIGATYSTEPTVAGVMLSWAQNQRATFRWVAAPNGEIVLPAVANNGVAVRTIDVAGSAVNTNVMMHYEE